MLKKKKAAWRWEGAAWRNETRAWRNETRAWRRAMLKTPRPNTVNIHCVCVYSVGELHWLLFRESPAMNGAETMAWSRYQQVARGYLGNAPPRRIRF